MGILERTGKPYLGFEGMTGKAGAWQRISWAQARTPSHSLSC